jgi:sugar lactone lactonase YvrE
MANNQPFVLKNAVEVSKNIDVTLGSISSSTVDLSTGNYFAETLTANTTYTFSNPGDVQSFQMEITGATVVTGAYDVATAVYTNNSFSVASQDGFPKGLAFNDTGTKMFIVGSGNDAVYEYALSTAWDVTTASYTRNYSVSARDGNPTGLSFANSGTKMYIAGYDNDSVYEFTLSTGFDLSSVTYVGAKSVATEDATPVGVYVREDGEKIYVLGQAEDEVSEYDMSTPYAVSSMSLNDQISITATVAQPEGLSFKSDGTVMYVTDNDDVFQFNLSTAWDITTATFDDSFSTSSQETSLHAAVVEDSGTRMFIVGRSSDTVYEYDLGSSGAATITWPASVDWPSGTEPPDPASGEKDMYSFITPDGGTTYYGFKSATNLS